MANISIENDKLVVTIRGWRRLWTLRRQLAFPLSSVRSATREPDVRANFPKFWEKRWGTNVFRTYYGGTFSRHGEKQFWDVLRPDNTVVITLTSERYQRLVVDVDDPEGTVRTITSAMRKTA